MFLNISAFKINTNTHQKIYAQNFFHFIIKLTLLVLLILWLQEGRGFFEPGATAY